MNILVSACLLGVRCRYDGASKPNEAVLKLMERHTLIPVCPEQLGGLATPRPPAERQAEGVFTQSGTDVTEQYRRGAEEWQIFAGVCDRELYLARRWRIWRESLLHCSKI